MARYNNIKNRTKKVVANFMRKVAEKEITKKQITFLHRRNSEKRREKH